MDVLVLGNLVVRRDDLVRRDDASAVRRRAV
jgi:hypothetical protein